MAGISVWREPVHPLYHLLGQRSQDTVQFEHNDFAFGHPGEMLCREIEFREGTGLERAELDVFVSCNRQRNFEGHQAVKHTWSLLLPAPCWRTNLILARKSGTAILSKH